jgi:hypothetical protein
MASVFDTNTDRGRAGSEMLYGGDANTAMYNSMIDSGFNPLRANPFVQMLMKAGQGLQLSSMIKNLGMNADQAADAGGGGELIRKAMTGAIQGGNVFGTLRDAAHSVPNALDMVTAIQDQIVNGQMDASQANPFAEILQNAFASPGATQRSMASLMAPSLGQDLGQAYSNQIGDIAQAGGRSFGLDVGAGNADNANFWNYVFRNTRKGQAPRNNTATPVSRSAVGAATPAGGNVQ